MSQSLFQFEKKLILPPIEKRDTVWQEQFISNYWMNLGDTSLIETNNPFSLASKYELENPHIFLLDLMRRPEYFGFTAKHIFGKTLPPFQLACLREMWKRPFQMLIGTRGMGKCIRGDSLVMTNDRICQIEELARGGDEVEPIASRNLRVFGENGFKDVAYSWNNGFSCTKSVHTRMGFFLEGTLNHPVRVVDGNEIVWRDLSDVAVGDTVVIDRKQTWYEPSSNISEDEAYLFGLLVGDGGYTKDGEIGFTTADEQLAETVSQLSMKVWGKPFRKQTAKYQYLLCGKEIWASLFNRFGFNSSVCGEKNFPSSVLGASKLAVAAFIRGLMDTDGSVSLKTRQVQFTAKSERIVRTLQFVLTRFGIIAKVRRRLNKTYNRYYFYIEMTGSNIRLFAESIGFGLRRKQEILLEAVNSPVNTNVDFIPNSLVQDDLLTLRERWADVRPKSARGYNYSRHLMSPSRIKAYHYTYENLNNVLSLTESLSYTEEWQRLDVIRQKHNYFDTIKSVEDGECITFDVHIPTDHSFISNGFVSHNSWLLAFYAMLKCLFIQGTKVVICGAAFRQAKVVFDYCAEIWDKSPILRDIVGPAKNNGPRRDVDRCSLRMGDSVITALPIGDGTKIRGQRASVVMADEFASVPVEIFETVIRGFGAVSKDPVLKLQQEARIAALRVIGAWNDADQEQDNVALMGNQTIISGTAYYAFNHFHDYWKQYKAIVESQGDVHKLEEVFNGKIPEKFNWKDYSVIRIPASKLPNGFMDQRQIAQAKATIHIGTYQMEYEAIFATDSNGFYKRSMIEACVVGKPTSPIKMSCGEVRFHCVTKGTPGRGCILSVDPASESDNLSVTILELWSDHRRIIFQWTTTRARYKAKLKKGLTAVNDYYGYAARKIRDLMKVFDIERIGMDSQGGGVAIMEALQDPDKLEDGELPIYQAIDEKEERDTDDMPGLHILEMVSFAKADWVSQANHGMKKDFEDKVLLFPEFNTAHLGLAIEADKMSGRISDDDAGDYTSGMYDTMEDAIMEIEELKDELATIVHTQTGTSLRDRWDTPETKIAGGKKGRLRKDRYSSLLIANMLARTIQRAPKEQLYSQGRGGFATTIAQGSKATGATYSGPQWCQMDTGDYIVVARRR